MFSEQFILFSEQFQCVYSVTIYCIMLSFVAIFMLSLTLLSKNLSVAYLTIVSR